MLDLEDGFSPEVLSLVKEIKECGDPGARRHLMGDLAYHFSLEHDETNPYNEDYENSCVDEYIRAKVQYQQAQMQLARHALQAVEMFCEDNDLALEDEPIHRVPDKGLN